MPKIDPLNLQIVFFSQIIQIFIFLSSQIDAAPLGLLKTITHVTLSRDQRLHLRHQISYYYNPPKIVIFSCKLSKFWCSPAPRLIDVLALGKILEMLQKCVCTVHQSVCLYWYAVVEVGGSEGSCLDVTMRCRDSVRDLAGIRLKPKLISPSRRDLTRPLTVVAPGQVPARPMFWQQIRV